MALKATIFKVALAVSDIDRNRYGDHALTLARHPSETDERLMLRVLAFALHADEALAFGRGLSTDDEPDLWRCDLTGVIEIWIDVGRPDERLVRKACGRAREVVVYTYGGSAADLWWQQNRERLERCANLRVVAVPPAATEALGRLAQRTMALQCTIHDGGVWLGDATHSVHVELVTLKSATAPRR